jgi:SAM-dependent methyltransferase
MAGQQSEFERLQLQSLTWEPAGRRLLQQLGLGADRRAIDVGCGCLGWLRLLSEWVGAGGSVVGTDIDSAMLKAAEKFVSDEGLDNVQLVRDDIFDSRLSERAFDLVHARFQICPLGRGEEQLTFYRRIAAPDGRILLEDPDSGTWHFNPPAPALERLIGLIIEAFSAGGGEFDAGRSEAALLRAAGLEPSIRSEVLALPPGHPYLRVPLQFSVSLEPRLLKLISAPELDALRDAGEAELAEPGRWGTTWTLIQTWASVPAAPSD